MDLSKSQQSQSLRPSSGQSFAGAASLFLRLWSYAGPSQPPTSIAPEQYPEVSGLIARVIQEFKGSVDQRDPELWCARFNDAFEALSAAKALQRQFLSFHRNTDPQQVVPSILIYETGHKTEVDSPAPQDMLVNVTSAQILVCGSIYELVKNEPGFQFNAQPVRKAGETFGPEAIYELLWTDESTYGHLRHASHTYLDNVGRYEILEEIGRGAMGAVYKAQDRLIGRTVALKAISIDRNTPDRDDLLERLKQEAKAAGQLDHPNIITIYDVGQQDDIVYLSMQFVEGRTLLRVLAEEGVPSLPLLISWADQITSAVGFAHSHGVIHRDLKPANLMLTTQGVIKVLDFGIAKIENSSLTQTGLVVGTPSYMAPEQVTGEKVDQRADIFALGSVFYELVTREKPFRGDITTVLYKIANEDPVAPSLINPAVPGFIDAIIRQALAKNPKQRFQTCEAMRNAFLKQASLFNIVPSASPLAIPARTEPPVLPLPSVSSSAAIAQQVARKPGSIAWILVVTTLMFVLTGWAIKRRHYHRTLPRPAVKVIEAVKSEVSTLHANSGSASEANTAIDRKQPGSLNSRQSRPDDSVSNGDTAGVVSADLPHPDQQGGTPSQSEKNNPDAVGISDQRTTSSSAQTSPGPTTSGSTTSAISGAEASSTPSQAGAQVPQVSSAAIPPIIDTKPAKLQATAATNSPRAAMSVDKQDPPQASPAEAADESTASVSAAPQPALKKPRPGNVLTIDGFTRSDVPELMRQADAAARRGDLRLAEYGCRVVLKLDPSNNAARELLRQVESSSN
jgi:serine/threonine protein kinase